jgi:hypothetical protein
MSWWRGWCCCGNGPVNKYVEPARDEELLSRYFVQSPPHNSTRYYFHTNGFLSSVWDERAWFIGNVSKWWCNCPRDLLPIVYDYCAVLLPTMFTIQLISDSLPPIVTVSSRDSSFYIGADELVKFCEILHWYPDFAHRVPLEWQQLETIWSWSNCRWKHVYPMSTRVSSAIGIWVMCLPAPYDGYAIIHPTHMVSPTYRAVLSIYRLEPAVPVAIPCSHDKIILESFIRFLESRYWNITLRGVAKYLSVNMRHFATFSNINQNLLELFTHSTG